jgi:phosphoribosyl 1,2-cyclic phosphate phosphodiesterase
MDGGNLLVDTPPELRLQLLDAGVSSVDAVWYTHLHADHVHGIDDLRIFTAKSRSTMPAFVPAEYAESLRIRFDYIFDPATWVAPGTSIPDLALREIHGSTPVEVLGEEVTPLPVPHGRMDVYGFRVGGLGYITDAKTLPPGVVDALQGVDVLVLNALWWGDPHATHLNIEEAIEAARTVGARATYLTHLTHRVLHEELEDRLPDGIRPAYDGLAVEVRPSGAP